MFAKFIGLNYIYTNDSSKSRFQPIQRTASLVVIILRSSAFRGATPLGFLQA